MGTSVSIVTRIRRLGQGGIVNKYIKVALKNDIHDEIKVLVCDKIKSKYAVEQITQTGEYRQVCEL